MDLGPTPPLPSYELIHAFIHVALSLSRLLLIFNRNILFPHPLTLIHLPSYATLLEFPFSLISSFWTRRFVSPAAYWKEEETKKGRRETHTHTSQTKLQPSPRRFSSAPRTCPSRPYRGTRCTARNDFSGCTRSRRPPVYGGRGHGRRGRSTNEGQSVATASLSLFTVNILEFASLSFR